MPTTEAKNLIETAARCMRNNIIVIRNLIYTRVYYCNIKVEHNEKIIPRDKNTRSIYTRAFEKSPFE